MLANSLQFDPATHTYTLGGKVLPSVTQILAPVETDFSLIRRDVLEAKRELGIAVHRLIELDAGDDLDEDSLDPQLVPYLTAWREFREKSGLVPIDGEIPIHSDEWGFAGTLDLICASTRGRSYFLVDVKCRDQLPASVGPQTAAYGVAYREQSGYDGPLHRRCLRLKNDGTYRLDRLDDPSDWQVFLACLSIHRWRRRHGL